MDQLFQNLFGQPLGTDTGTTVALSAVSTGLSVAALFLLARRNDLGWWARILAVFAGPLVIALTYGYEGLVSAVPTMAAAAYGLWRFSRYPLEGRFTRDVDVRGFGLGGLVWGVVLTALFTALGLGTMLTTGFAFGGGTGQIWANFACTAALTVAFVGIAHGLRWAWLAVAASAAGQVALYLSNQPALATLFLLVLQAFAGLYGWWTWRPAPAEARSAERDAYPPSPYSA